VLTQIIVFGVIFGVIAGGIWLYKSSRAEQAETSEALAEMARTLETTYDATSQSMTGRLNGRAVSIHQEWHRAKPEEHNRYIRMTVEVTAETTSLELLRQGSAFAPAFKGDVQTGDRAFDRAFMVRSDNGGKVQQVLTLEVRRQVLDQQWLGELRVKDGQLRCMGGVGFLRKSHVEEAMIVLRLMVRIADGLR